MLNKFKLLTAGIILFTPGLLLKFADAAPSSAPSDAAASNPGALVDQARELMDEKKYEQALLPLKKCMGLHGHDADAISRHEVLMLVAECDLQTHQVAESMKVLEEAINESTAAKDWPHTAEAFSLVTLLHESPKLYYAPKVGEEHRSLDLTDLSQRKTAYQKLQEEKLNFCSDQQRAGRELASIQSLLDNAAAFAISRALEQTLTGRTKKSDVLGDKLAVWSDGMITATLQSYTPRIAAIVLDSNVTMKGRRAPGKPVGLSNDQRSEMQGIDAICKQVPDAITQLTAEYARPLMTHAERNITTAKNIATRVEAILSVDSKILRNRKPA